MGISALSYSSLYQLIPSSGQPGAASAAQANPAILPVDDFTRGSRSRSVSRWAICHDNAGGLDCARQKFNFGRHLRSPNRAHKLQPKPRRFNNSMSSLTAPSDQFQSYLTQIGNALSSGDLATAQSTYGTAQWWQPTSPIIAMGEAVIRQPMMVPIQRSGCRIWVTSPAPSRLPRRTRPPRQPPPQAASRRQTRQRSRHGAIGRS